MLLEKQQNTLSLFFLVVKIKVNFQVRPYFSIYSGFLYLFSFKG